VYAALRGYVAEAQELKKTLPGAVKGAIETKVAESGQVTASFVHINSVSVSENMTHRQWHI
jgi:hypothetical protein